jgi:hypothetical protein
VLLKPFVSLRTNSLKGAEQTVVLISLHRYTGLLTCGGGHDPDDEKIKTLLDEAAKTVYYFG